MQEHKPLYKWSLKEAIQYRERDQWRESYRENCDCARAIEKAIGDHYRDNCLAECAAPILQRYGFNRVNWVLGNTIQQKSHDGRFSEANKQWARQFRIPDDDVRWHFTVEAHPGLTNLFVDQTRKAWQNFGLFDESHCVPDDSQQDYTGKVVVINPHILKDDYKTPEDQLFFVEGGFGARPNSRGRKVFGKFLKDDISTHYFRENIIGVLKSEYLPQWAWEKLAQWENPAEKSAGMTMGGI